MGDGIVIQGNDNANTKLRLTNTGVGGESWQIQVGQQGSSNSNFVIRDNTAGTTRLIIDSSGNLLVGTASLTIGTKIEVNTSTGSAAALVCATATDYSLYAHNKATSSDNKFINFGTEASFTTRGNIDYDRTNNALRVNGSNALALGTGGTTRALIDSSGNFTATGNVTAYSDERLKENWNNLDVDIIEKISQVKTGLYDRKDLHLRQIGVSAQSLKEVLPEAIIENEDGYLSVAYGNTALALCVELAKELVKLKNELKELKQ
jgi:hypothetical protein